MGGGAVYCGLKERRIECGLFGGSELKRRLVAVAVTVLPLCLARDLTALKHTSMLGVTGAFQAVLSAQR